MSAVRPPKSGLVDLVAVRRCDRAFDALAGRRDAHFDDPAVQLLTALVIDVDADLPMLPIEAEERAEERDPPLAPVRIHPDRRPSSGSVGRRPVRLLGARTALAASVAVAALTSTGVAAANIGHFAPVGRVLGIGGHTASPVPSGAAVGEVRGALVTAGGLLEEGRYVAARQALNRARQRLAQVRGEDRTALIGEIERLEARLARETAGQRVVPNGRKHGATSSGPSIGNGESAKSPKPPKLPGAAGKDGKDKDGKDKDGNIPVPDAGNTPDAGAVPDTGQTGGATPSPDGVDLQVGDDGSGDAADEDASGDDDADPSEQPGGGPSGQAKDHPKGGPPGKAKDHGGGNR